MTPPEERAREVVVGVRAHLGCGRTHVEPPRGRLPLVGCYVGLDLPCVGVLPDALVVWAFGKICLVTGPLFFSYVQDGNTLCMFAYSCHISMLFM